MLDAGNACDADSMEIPGGCCPVGFECQQKGNGKVSSAYGGRHRRYCLSQRSTSTLSNCSTCACTSGLTDRCAYISYVLSFLSTMPLWLQRWTCEEAPATYELSSDCPPGARVGAHKACSEFLERFLRPTCLLWASASFYCQIMIVQLHVLLHRNKSAAGRTTKHNRTTLIYMLTYDIII